MSIEVTARHMQVEDDIQEYAKRQAEGIRDEFPRVEHVHVILDVEKKRRIAEVIVQAKNHIRVGITESSDNMRVSIDLAVDKTSKQLRRSRDKVQDRKAVRKHEEKIRSEGVED